VAAVTGAVGEAGEGQAPVEATEHGATLSACGRWRYDLTRRWSPGPAVLWVGLNPSRADAVADDHTLRRIMTFSRQGGFGAVVLINLYALRATNPAELARHSDPVGPDNDCYLAAHAARHDVVVVAWGTTRVFPGREGQRRHQTRIEAVLAILEGKELCCVGRTRHGHPRHPSRVGAVAALEAWTSSAARWPREPGVAASAAAAAKAVTGLR
jgi:hypothetical protein